MDGSDKDNECRSTAVPLVTTCKNITAVPLVATRENSAEEYAASQPQLSLRINTSCHHSKTTWPRTLKNKFYQLLFLRAMVNG